MKGDRRKYKRTYTPMPFLWQYPRFSQDDVKWKKVSLEMSRILL
jgi:hypothetical protein